MPYTGQAEEPMRLWGPEESVVRKFGWDVEKVVWVIMVEMACELEGKMRDWEKIKHVCRKAGEHWDAVFGEGMKVVGKNSSKTVG